MKKNILRGSLNDLDEFVNVNLCHTFSSMREECYQLNESLLGLDRCFLFAVKFFELLDACKSAAAVTRRNVNPDFDVGKAELLCYHSHFL